MNWSVAELLLLARLCDAAYLPSSQPAVEALGLTYVAQVATVECQATIVVWDDRTVVAFSGTHAGTDPNLLQFFDNLDGRVVELGGAVRVARGYWEPMAVVWPEIAHRLTGRLTGKTLLTGHSLGGSRAHLAKIYQPDAEVVSFGAPRCAGEEFWWKVYPDSHPTRVVHQRDFAPHWAAPSLTFHPAQPGPMMWLHDGQLDYPTYRRPGTDLSVPDHSIRDGYIAALEALSAS